jgi:hypothetical protein
MEKFERKTMSGLADLQLQDPNVQAKNIIRGNLRLAGREVAEEVGIYIGSCHTILSEDLGIQWVSGKSVPRLLTDDQKLQRLFICENVLQISLLVTRRASRVKFVE